MSKVPKKESFVKFFQCIKKKVLQLLLRSIAMQKIQILYGISVMFVVTCFSVVVVKKGRRSLDHRTMKSAVSQENELIKWADFFACWYKFSKANVNLIIVGWVWSKMGKTFRSYGTLKSGASHIWYVSCLMQYSKEYGKRSEIYMVILHSYWTQQFQKIFIPSIWLSDSITQTYCNPCIAFSLHNFKLLPIC